MACKSPAGTTVKNHNLMASTFKAQAPSVGKDEGGHHQQRQLVPHVL